MRGLQLFIWVGLLAVAVTSCSTDENRDLTPNEVPKEKKKFEMYEQSEMTALMLHMYQVNEQLRKRILAGEDIGDFSESFERILHAEQTGGKELDDFFQQHAQTFLNLQRSIYDHPETATEQFNVAIDACIACHQVKCTGPIQKIEKLYIK
jgi:cytochrome c553